MEAVTAESHLLDGLQRHRHHCCGGLCWKWQLLQLASEESTGPWGHIGLGSNHNASTY